MATFQQVNPNGTVKKNLKWVKWVVAGAAALVIAFSSFTIVPAGSTGVDPWQGIGNFTTGGTELQDTVYSVSRGNVK